MIRGDSPNDLVFTGKGAEHVLHWFALAFGPRHLDPAPVHHEVADGEELEVAGGMRAIHTPGHTIGHVSYLLARQEGNVLFVGDAAANLFGRLSAPQGGHNDDPPAINPSIQKLAELDFDIACFGHGRVLRGGANAAFRRLVEKLSS
jgi:glyoxylase-like metal-dependent hydrolase (beta-lactamase superfamily II)